MLLIILLGGAYLASQWYLHYARRFELLSGVPIVSMGSARARAARACRRAASAMTLTFALELPLDSHKGSYLIMGAPRSGKSVIMLIFRMRLLEIFNRSDQEIIVIDFDPKRENQLWAHLLHPSIPYFDLSPSVEGVGIDLIGECQNDIDVATIADTFLPAARGDSQPHFRNTAVVLLAAVLRAARFHGHTLTLRHVVFICTDLDHLRRYLRSCPATAPIALAHLSGGEESMSVFSTLSSAVHQYRTVAAAWHHADRLITIEEFLSLPKAVLNLPYEDDAMPVLVPILRLILLRLEQKILKQNKKGRLIFFILDEFRILRDLRFYLLACKGAEAGVSLVYACQSYVGAKEAHGELITQELFGLCKNRIFMRVDNPADANYVSESMGSHSGLMRTFSKDGWSESQVTFKNADPTEVMNLRIPSDRDLVIRGFGNTPYTRPFKLRFPFRRYLPFLNAAKSVPPLNKRPPAHLDLPALTRAERRELGL